MTLPVWGGEEISNCEFQERILDVHYHGAGLTARSNRGRRSNCARAWSKGGLEEQWTGR